MRIPDVLRFSTCLVSDGAAKPMEAVSISVNGHDLIDLVRDVELPFARREGHPELAGSYLGLEPKDVVASRLLPRTPHDDHADVRKVTVLVCECGEEGCWPLRATITVTPDSVIWSDFEQPHRGPEDPARHWEYDRLGPFVFERGRYEAELTRLGRTLRD